jgi:hypothetical protein
VKRKALLVDLDGTLFLLGDRSPYDVALCGLDTVNPQVLQAMQWARADGWGIVLVSGRGRKDGDRYYTEQALWWNGIEYDQLSMRKVGDDRKDDVVKRELYEREIAPQWDAQLVLDDRKSVVVMWRHDLKIPTWQTDDRLDHEMSGAQHPAPCPSEERARRLSQENLLLSARVAELEARMRHMVFRTKDPIELGVEWLFGKMGRKTGNEEEPHDPA